MLTSVSVNKRVDNGVNVLMISNVLRECIVTIISSTVLTRVHNDCITLQLANPSNDDVNLKIGTKLCEAEYYNDENDNVLMQNTIVCKTNYRNDNVVNSNVTAKGDKGTLPPQYLEDIRCDHTPVKERLAYKILFAFQKQLDDTINTILKDGIITHSKSNFNSPIIIVKRENLDIRPCLDYRALNEVIKLIYYPLPRISDVLNSIGQNEYMSILDMTSAFHQRLIHPDQTPSHPPYFSPV